MKMNKSSFKGKVVLVTGAASGIGAACALKFAAMKATLSLFARVGEDLRSLANRCQALSGIVPLYTVGDVILDEDLDKLVFETIRYLGKVDVLINTSGVTIVGDLEDDIKIFDYVMATNTRGTYNLTNKLMPYLLKTKGNIVNVSSVLATKPIPSMTAYCMSKAATDMFTKCVALEYGPRGVRANTVNIGPTKSDFVKKTGVAEEVNKKLFSELKSAAPLRRVSEVEEAAELVAFLASDAGGSITGSSVVLDCGLSLSDTAKL